MNQSRQEQHNLWCLTVLCLLRVQPMHPYELQRRIRDWHKDEFLDLKRGSLYHAIDRLRAHQCIEAIETSREGRRPERTVYRLTETGQRQMVLWLQEMLSQPVREPSQFFAALSFLPVLLPLDVQAQLKDRIGRLEREIVELGSVLEMMVPQIGRLVLVEVEYLRSMRQAELSWVRSLLEDLASGKLEWDPKAMGAGPFPCVSHPNA